MKNDDNILSYLYENISFPSAISLTKLFADLSTFSW